MKRSWKAAMLASAAVGALVLGGCGSDQGASGDKPQIGVAIWRSCRN